MIHHRSKIPIKEGDMGDMSSVCYSYLVVQGCPNPWRGGDTGTLVLGPLPPSLRSKLPGMQVIISVFILL